MRGSISTSALILFVAFAATVAVLAYIVDMTPPTTSGLACTEEAV